MARIFGILFLKGPAIGLLEQPGWSEVYGFNVADYTAAVTALGNLANARQATLAPDCSIIGARISDSDVKGDSFPTGITFPSVGTYNPGGAMTTYNPQMALRFLWNAGPTKRGSRFLRCIPKDSVSASGLFTPVAGFSTVLLTYLGLVESEVSMATKIPGAVAPPFYTFTAYTGFTEFNMEKRAIGRPFGLSRGRRLVA